MEVATMTYVVPQGISLRRCKTFPWSQKLDVLTSRIRGMCGSLEDTAMRWFKSLNRLQIMRSHLIHVRECFSKTQGFCCLQKYLDNCPVLCVGLDCTQLTICSCSGQTYCMFLPSSVRWFRLKDGENKKKQFARETATVVNGKIPTRELKRGQ